jgi:hypothetical protein
MAKQDTVRQVAVVLAALAQIAGSALHPLGLAPLSVGGRTEPVSTPVVPAGYAFAIWGVIFLLGAVFAVWQALPRNAEDPLLRRLGWPVAATFAGNALWETLAQYGVGDVPLAVVLAVVVGTALIALRIVTGWPEPAGARRWWTVDAPVGLTAGWVSAALFANLSTAVKGVTRAPDGSVLWLVLIGVAAVFAAVQVLRARGALAYAVGVAWALAGIAAANFVAENTPAMICAAVGLIVLAVATAAGRRSHRSLAPATAAA